MNKRGEVEVQFNWIYIMIVGAIILLIGFSIIPSIKRSSDQNVEMDIVAHFDTMLSSIKHNTDSENEFSLFGSEFSFSCNEYFLKGVDNAGISTQDQAIFSPDKIMDQLQGFSAPWLIPFNADYLTFITSPKVRYIVKESKNADTLFELLPSLISKESISQYSKIKLTDYYKLRLITFGEVPSANLNIKKDIDDNEISLVKIELLDDKEFFPDSFGRIDFYIKNGNNFKKMDEAYFFDKASLIGAIYSEDADYYKCNLQKSLLRLNIITQIKKDRLSELQSYNKLKHCPYETAKLHLQSFSTITKDLQDTKSYYQSIYDISKKIKNENLMLQRLSCPLIY